MLPYRIVGSGMPCIVYGSAITYSLTYSARFQSALRCVYLDGRIYVPSAPRPDGAPYSVAEAVEDIEAVRQQLHLDRFVMVGNSVFGLVAMAYAARYPQHVTHVIAVGPPPMLPWNADSVRAYRQRQFSPARRAQHAINRQRLDSLSRAHQGRGFIPEYIANAALYWADSTFDATALFEGVEVNDALFNDLVQTPFSWSVVPRSVQVPVFVALGRHDYVITPNLWTGVSTPFSALRVHVFESAGHWPHLEDQPRFDGAVLAWLRTR
jgi:proline iminopeptidase